MTFIKGNKINKGRVFTEEHRKKLSLAHRGKPLSKSHRKAVINALRKTPRKKNPRRGKNHPNWLDGRSLTTEYKSFHDRRSSLKRDGISGSHIWGEWQILKAQYDFTCPSCGKREPEIKLTEDHIIPVSRGGSDNIENIQPLCLSCNMRKYTKVIKYGNDPKSKD